MANYRPLWRTKGVLALGIVAELVAYLLTLTKVMGNWWFVLATGLIALSCRGSAESCEPDAFRGAARLPHAGTVPSSAAAPGDPRRSATRSRGRSMPALEISEVYMAFGGAKCSVT